MNNRILSVLSNKPFLYLWLAEVFSQVAMNMVNFVLIIVAYKVSNSNTAVSGIVLSFTIPAILFGLLAGVYVDRWHKKKVLLWTNILRAVFLLALLFIPSNLFVIYVVTFVIAFITQFFIPAESPMIPVLVKKDQLLSANALFGLGIYGSIFFAYALSGPLLLFFGDMVVFTLLSILFLIAAGFVLLIRVPAKVDRVVEKRKEVSVMKDLWSALAVMAKTKEISQSLLLLTIAQLLVLIVGVIGPGYATQILKIKLDAFALLFITPASLGMVVGAVVVGTYFQNFSKSMSATLGVLLAGVVMLLLPYGGAEISSNGFILFLNGLLPFSVGMIHIVVILAFFLGFSNSLVFVPSNTVLQEHTTDSLRGKVYGGLNALIGIFSLVPIIMVGGLSDIFGVGRVLTGIGIVIVALGVFRVVMTWRK